MSVCILNGVRGCQVKNRPQMTNMKYLVAGYITNTNDDTNVYLQGYGIVCARFNKTHKAAGRIKSEN